MSELGQSVRVCGVWRGPLSAIAGDVGLLAQRYSVMVLGTMLSLGTLTQPEGTERSDAPGPGAVVKA